MSGKPKVEADPSTAGKSKGKKKLLLLAIPLLLTGLGAGLWFSGVLTPLLSSKSTSAEAAKVEPVKPDAGPSASEPGAVVRAAVKPLVFADLPDIVANLNAGPRRNVFVKLHVKLELEKPEDQAIVTAAMPRLLDLFQTYLRDMRPEELRGSEGTYRLREELLARASLATAPAHVADVLFTELLVQ